MTCGGDPVCPLDSPHKKPYELAYIAKRIELNSKIVDDSEISKVCISCPPSCHSRKPPLEAILPRLAKELGIDAELANSVPTTWVELFGRECRPGGLVIGNQAIALNRLNSWVLQQP